MKREYGEKRGNNENRGKGEEEKRKGYIFTFTSSTEFRKVNTKVNAFVD